MEDERVGTLVEWAGTIWYVDNSDYYIKDDGEPTSLYLIPEKYQNPQLLEYIWRSKTYDEIGCWVPASDVKEIKNEHILA